MRDGYFVVTSNVDGHFQKAGFEPDTVFEVHGRIHRLQCSEPCCDRTFSTEGLQLDIDEANLRCRSELPECPVCGAVARPNILMFSDWKWVDRANRRCKTRSTTLGSLPSIPGRWWSSRLELERRSRRCEQSVKRSAVHWFESIPAKRRDLRERFPLPCQVCRHCEKSMRSSRVSASGADWSAR